MDWFQNYWWTLLIAVLLLPIAAIALFARWLRSQAALEFDDKIKSWDVFVKLVSALTVVASGAVLIGKYFDQREQVARQEEARSQQDGNLRAAEFLRQKLVFETERHERRRTLLNEAKVLAARLANTTSPAAADVRRFDELYDADLIGVEQLNGEVEKHMVLFRRRLRGESNPSGEPFNQLALRLAQACETELKASEDALLEQHKAIAALVAPTAAK